jgi:hypothetical protein
MIHQVIRISGYQHTRVSGYLNYMVIGWCRGMEKNHRVTVSPFLRVINICILISW